MSDECPHASDDCNGEQLRLRALLAKYIDHVALHEGTDFLGFRDPWWTDEEWHTLQRLRFAALRGSVSEAQARCFRRLPWTRK